MSKTAFENAYWQEHNQQIEARHKLALALSSSAASILTNYSTDMFIQPGLIQLQPNLDEKMDMLEPIQPFLYG